MRNDRDWHLTEAEHLLRLAADEREPVKVSLLLRRAREHMRLYKLTAPRGR